MFNEIGKKIKLIAEIYAAAMPALTLLAWPLYGFGQLVQDVHDLRLGDGSMNIHGDDLPQL